MVAGAVATVLGDSAERISTDGTASFVPQLAEVRGCIVSSDSSGTLDPACGGDATSGLRSANVRRATAGSDSTRGLNASSRRRTACPRDSTCPRSAPAARQATEAAYSTSRCCIQTGVAAHAGARGSARKRGAADPAKTRGTCYSARGHHGISRRVSLGRSRRPAASPPCGNKATNCPERPHRRSAMHDDSIVCIAGPHVSVPHR